MDAKRRKERLHQLGYMFTCLYLLTLYCVLSKSRVFSSNIDITFYLSLQAPT